MTKWTRDIEFVGDEIVVRREDVGDCEGGGVTRKCRKKGGTTERGGEGGGSSGGEKLGEMDDEMVQIGEINNGDEGLQADVNGDTQDGCGDEGREEGIGMRIDYTDSKDVRWGSMTRSDEQTDGEAVRVGSGRRGRTVGVGVDCMREEADCGMVAKKRGGEKVGGV